MRICIVGPIATENVAHLLWKTAPILELKGYRGAPILSILIEGLLERGHEVVAVSADDSISVPVREKNGRFEFVLTPRRKKAFRRESGQWGRAADFFRKERESLLAEIKLARPDVVNAHWSYEFSLAAIESGFPHLITCHDSPWQILKMSRSLYCGVRYLMARKVFNEGRFFSTVSNYMALELSRYIKEPPEVIPNPVHSSVFDLGAERHIKKSGVKIAFVCNGWSIRKNPESAIKAFSVFRIKNRSAELHLFGADFEPGGVGEKWAKEKMLADGLVFRGAIPHSNLIAELNRMDVLLHTSLEESFGVVLAEAMALGIPVVAGKESGAVPWVMGADERGVSKSGVLTDISSPSLISKALEDVLDLEAYVKYSRNAISHTKHLFSHAKIAERYEVKYGEVIRAGSFFGLN